MKKLQLVMLGGTYKSCSFTTVFLYDVSEHV